MAHRILPTLDAASEAHDIHQAACRYRRQGLVCSTCSELLERLISARSSATAEAA